MSPLVLVVGALIGLSLGVLGGGGSILTVPALVYLVGQDAHEATAGSLVIVGTTSLIALVPHARRGNVRFTQGLIFGALGSGGAILGSKANAHIPAQPLLLSFAVLLLLVAVLMIRRARSQGADAGSEYTTEPILTLRPLTCACPRLLKLVVAATVVGLLTGFFGVGGGFAVVPALALALSFPMPVAVGTSLLVIAANSVTALASRAHLGIELDWPLIAAFTGVAVVASLIGARISARLPARALSAGFAGLLILISVFMIASTLLG